MSKVWYVFSTINEWYILLLLRLTTSFLRHPPDSRHMHSHQNATASGNFCEQPNESINPYQIVT